MNIDISRLRDPDQNFKKHLLKKANVLHVILDTEEDGENKGGIARNLKLRYLCIAQKMHFIAHLIWIL